MVALAALAALVMWLRPPSPASGADAALLLAFQPGEPLGGVPPLWWLVGRGLMALTGSAFAGWHLAVAGGWVALVRAVWRVAGRLGSGRAGAIVALAAVAAWPTLLWRAGTVGPELPGTALAAVAAHLLLRARITGSPLWPGALAAAAACGVWAPALWLVAPLAAWVGRAVWDAGRSREALTTLGGAAAAVGVTWGGWWLAGGLARGLPEGGGVSWIAVAVGSPWLGLAALVLAVAGGAAAWQRGRREVVLVASAGAALPVLGALLTSSSSLLLAVPAVALLWGGLCAPGGRCRRAAVAAAAIWAASAVVWAWPALQARREPAPAWAVLGWAREHLKVGGEPVVCDPELAAMARLVLAPAGFELLSGETEAARAAIEAGQGPVRIGLRAEPGAMVLKALRWPSGRVQRLVRPEDAACVVSKLSRTDPVRVSRGWRKVDGGFELVETGVVALEDGTPARALKLKVASGRVRVRMAGLPVLDLGAETPLSTFVLVPGPAGAMVFEPVGGPARFAVADLALREGGGHPAVIVPQAAAVTGIGGSYWQTDLVLANPHPVPATAEVLFLPSERANPTVRSVRFEVPARGSRLVENVLAVGELRQGPRTGALLVRAAGCTPPGCGLEVLSRTYNIQGESCDPVAEGLPGLSPERGLRAGGVAVFERVANDNAHRGYVGFASWSGSPVQVRAVLRGGDARVLGQLDERLEAWSHRHLRLPASCQGATLTVSVEGGPEALVFPYLSTVASAHNCSTHRYADRVEGTATGKIAPRDPACGEGSRPDG
ncbi:MAG: hypothetical protein AB2L07_04745 [Thermoanaerobaculaceae bacterium]